jgi:hypothetical protein
MLHARAAYLPADATLLVSHSLLVTLLVPLLATLGALLSILGGDMGRHIPNDAWGQARLSHLVADSVPSGGAALILDGVLESAG